LGSSGLAHRSARSNLLIVSAPNELDVAYVAQLARLNLSAEEISLFEKQLGGVLEHVARLQKLDLDGVEPAAHAVPALNIFREDETRASLSQEEALRAAPRTANGLFIVPKVIE
jgi:aspartyl-tRNA(Asn)/glutamyl-tRNA(Gln) amidotransferase subunit C